MPTHNNQTYDYFRGDYVALNDYFSTIDWDLLFDGNSISQNWNVFKEKIFEGCQKFILMSSVSHQKSSPWWTKALSRAIVKKRSLYFKYRATKNKSWLLKARVHSAQMTYEEKLVKSSNQSQSTLLLPQV